VSNRSRLSIRVGESRIHGDPWIFMDYPRPDASPPTVTAS
jgi:hypothetical protein